MHGTRRGLGSTPRPVTAHGDLVAARRDHRLVTPAAPVAGTRTPGSSPRSVR
jgi:hypothetical protein